MRRQEEGWMDPTPARKLCNLPIWGNEPTHERIPRWLDRTDDPDDSRFHLDEKFKVWSVGRQGVGTS